MLSVENIKQLQLKPYALTCSDTPLGCNSIDFVLDKLSGGFGQKDTEAVLQILHAKDLEWLGHS